MKDRRLFFICPDCDGSGVVPFVTKPGGRTCSRCVRRGVCSSGATYDDMETRLHVLRTLKTILDLSCTDRAACMAFVDDLERRRHGKGG